MKIASIIFFLPSILSIELNENFFGRFLIYQSTERLPKVDYITISKANPYVPYADVLVDFHLPCYISFNSSKDLEYPLFFHGKIHRGNHFTFPLSPNGSKDFAAVIILGNTLHFETYHWGERNYHKANRTV